MELKNQIKSISIYSGESLNVDPDNNLMGECDFIITKSEPFPELSSPICTLVEAKKGEIKLGLGQCIAQIIGSEVFNKNEGIEFPYLYGCVTNGYEWSFIKKEKKHCYN